MVPMIPTRLKIGLDVPWVTSWTEEIQGGVGPCPTVDGQPAALQAWKPGLGAMPDRELKAFPPSWVVVPLYVAAENSVTGRPLSAVSFLQLLGITEGRDANWRDRLPSV